MQLTIELLEQWYTSNFEDKISGLYITFDMIAPLLENIEAPFEKEMLGYSEQSRPIYKLSIGNGEKRILLWSQMHGNESTGTKALFDLFKFLTLDHELNSIKEAILSNCTLVFIPMLNPDGSEAFTRVNANGIDLNRDVLDQKAKESVLLYETLKKVYPQFCFNLHDQRTIFNVEGTKNPATISFLAPSEDEERTLTHGRMVTMSVIVAMNELLQKAIPKQIGRYTDEFYPTATGDNFQKAGHNTILIEAGHYKDDYEREQVRKYNFFALVKGLHFIATAENFDVYKPYFDIPNNAKQCFDIIYRKAKFPEDQVNDVAVQYDYKVVDGNLTKVKRLEKIGYLNAYFGHEEIDALYMKIDVKDLLNS